MANPSQTPYGPRDAVADWLRANGIDPGDVPIEGPIAIKDDSIQYAALLRDEAGHVYADPATGDAACEQRTAPLTVQPPTNVQVPPYADWATDHYISYLAQTQSRPGPDAGDGTWWMERRTTGKGMVVCSCGYASGLASIDELPTPQSLEADHPGMTNVLDQVANPALIGDGAPLAP
ncbi:hypothetical protein AB0J25_11905 [Streptomyces sp. NPDC049910]|uniref:hypothetical protein n=1 Tax=Streptomyces sp. NPDC049910 TaxID=3155278 RepID=UPI0034454AE4